MNLKMNLSALMLCSLLVLSSFGMISATIPDKIKIEIDPALNGKIGSDWARNGHDLAIEHNYNSPSNLIDDEGYLHPLRGIGYEHNIDADEITCDVHFPLDEMNLITYHKDGITRKVVNAYYNNGSVRYYGYYIPNPRKGTTPTHDEPEWNSGHWVNP
ncbi:MAG: hypothetical protein LBD03_09760 [Methanobrevibacter sp.]|jgi:hypothetical protein|nr:hypothetical protein [Candidatus Methanovirga procula]